MTYIFERKSKGSIIITVPHGLCYNKIDGDYRHTCDSKAETFANILHDKILTRLSTIKDNSKRKIELTTFHANVHRTEYDLNRRTSRDTDFRRSLSRKLENDKNEDKAIWLLDVHSFPNDHDSFQEKDLVILRKYIPKRYDETDQRLIKLKNMVNSKYKDYDTKRKFTCKILMGSQENDIVETAYNVTNFAYLLEVNENLTTIQLKSLADIIVECVTHGSRDWCDYEINEENMIFRAVYGICNEDHFKNGSILEIAAGNLNDSTGECEDRRNCITLYENTTEILNGTCNIMDYGPMKPILEKMFCTYIHMYDQSKLNGYEDLIKKGSKYMIIAFQIKIIHNQIEKLGYPDYQEFEGIL